MKNNRGIALITGTSHGIGKSTAIKFLDENYIVYGIDIDDAPRPMADWMNHDPSYYIETVDVYRHIKGNINKMDFNSEEFDFLKDVDILVNNAGTQENSITDIETNLLSPIRLTEKVLSYKHVKSILNVASVSAHNGEEYFHYVASKGGLLPYTKNVAQRCAEWGCTCNSISPGGVITDMNKSQLNNKESWEKIMAVTPLKKWAYPSEIADWIYFITCCQSSMTGQDVIIDNGENVYPKFVE